MKEERNVCQEFYSKFIFLAPPFPFHPDIACMWFQKDTRRVCSHSLALLSQQIPICKLLCEIWFPQKTRTSTWSKLAVQIILKEVVNLRSRLELRKLLQLSCSRAFPGMAKRSTISVFFLLNVIVFMLPSILIAQRCDRQVYSNIWHRCTECNINVLQGCPIGYQQVTSGEGVQRCTIFLNFGPNLGRISVPGCQHLCRRTLIQKECCSGFWGQDCQGILRWNLSVKSYNSNTQISLVVE